MIFLFDITKSFSYYKKNEFCKAINCKELPKRLNEEPNECSQCMAYKFHDYLNTNKYHLIKNDDTDTDNENQHA